MTIVDIDVSSAQEPIVVPANEEYKLRIVDCKVADDKNGKPYMLPRFEIVDEPLAKEFTRFIRLPHSDQTEKEKARTAWSLKVFCECFDIDPAKGIDTDSIKGATGWAILGIETDPEYGEQNTVKKFVRKG